MVAVPVFRSRVAPVLNWCSKVLVFPEDAVDGGYAEEVVFCRADAFERLRMLRSKGVRTLICGALSPDLLRYGESLGLNIIYGVAGDIEEVLEAHQKDELDQPCFWLPGCRCRRRYRAAGWGKHVYGQERSANMPGGQGKGRGQGQGQGQGQGRGQGQGQGQGPGRGGGRGRQGGMAAGPGGSCVCPKCGAKKEHERGIPCAQIKCPDCGQPMVRE